MTVWLIEKVEDYECNSVAEIHAIRETAIKAAKRIAKEWTDSDLKLLPSTGWAVVEDTQGKFELSLTDWPYHVRAYEMEVRA
jgi:hypothetical protein